MENKVPKLWKIKCRQLWKIVYRLQIAVVTGKAGAIRVAVPQLDMQIPFEDIDEYDIEACFKAISELIETVNMFSLAGGISNL